MNIMKKATGWIIALVLILGIAGTGVWVAAGTGKTTVSAETVYKETTVQYGNLTVGVEESGSIAIGTVSQTFSLSLSGTAKTSTTASSGSTASSVASSSGSMSGTTGGTSGGVSGATGSSSTSGSTGATSTSGSTAAASTSSTASSTGSATLEIESVHVVVGQVVKKGDILLKLTDASVADTRAALTSAVTSADLSLKEAIIARDKAVLQASSTYSANKALSETAKAEYDATISALTASVTSAQNTYDKARKRIAAIPGEISDLDDQKTAAEKAGNTSLANNLQSQIDSLKEELSTTKANLSNLSAQLEKAKRNKVTQSISAQEKYDESLLTAKNATTLYNIAMDGINDEVTSATEKLETAKENLAEFNAYVGDGKIMSEYTGTITAVGATAGSTLSTSTTLATFQNAEAVTMTVSVAQDDISTIKVGLSAVLELSAYEGETYKGSVTKIATSTTNTRSSTVSYPVTVTLSGDVSKIYAGMTGNLTFITKEVTNILYVSNKAITLDGTRSYVKKKNSDGTTTRVEVTTGFSDGYQVEIVSGLNKGDIVLIESQVKA